MYTANIWSVKLEDSSARRMYVTMRVNRECFGIEVSHVRDVLRRQKITPIPLAPREVLGLLNLRGRIATVIDLRRRLRLAEKNPLDNCTFVVVELKGELYSLVVDSVMEVLTIRNEEIEQTSANLGDIWKQISSGIYRMPEELLVIVNVQALLALD